MSVEHKGWDWTDVTSDSWNLISEEFLPVAINWCQKFKSILDLGTGKRTDITWKSVSSLEYPRLKTWDSVQSKENPNFDKDKSIDGYTMISSEGFEKGIPHAFVDEKDIWELTYPFKIISMNKIQHFIRNGNPAKGIHYFVHIKKEK